MRQVFLGICLLLLAVSLTAQQPVSYEQAFKGAPTNMLQPLPMISSWLDGKYYLETRTENNVRKTVKVNAATGAAEDYTAPAAGNASAAVPAIAIQGARNQTTSPDGRYFAYTKADNNLYIQEIATKKESRLTNDGNDSLLNGYASWIYFEEILGRASRYKAFWWSEDGKHLAFMRFDESGMPVFPIYVADGQHGSLENNRYPKPGDKNPAVKIGVVNIQTGTTTWADFNEKEDQYFGTPVWTPGGELWISWMNRGQDQLKVYKVDLATGSKNLVYEESQKTWIDLDDTDRFEFLPSGKGFILRSDASGWKHFYLHDMSGKRLATLTSGDFTVGDIHKIDEKAKRLYFDARKENSARTDLYSVGLDGKNMVRHSFGDYTFRGMTISPDNKLFITTYSNLQTVPTMVLVDMKGKIVRELGSAKGKDADLYAQPKRELIRVKSADGLFDLPVLITYPIGFDPAKKYPVIINIYGGPNAGTVYDTYRANPAELWWANEGLVQVAIDNRSSGHFGKKGMNFIHRQLGKYEIEDYMSAAGWLRKQPWIAGDRIGITGGSFGGYMTAMALTYGSDYFTHGIANASVMDWSLYDTHYTERFMDTPAENPEGYKATSVLTYADRLKGTLRIVHGTTDDNVHMQNSIQLINRLQDLGKPFEMMVYPNERHGIGANVRAKRDHLVSENASFFYKYLLNKPVPEVFWKKTERKAF
ncbi:DPP IV N-terminal domain-containing protein [Flavihumibacter sp. CACIAM 22H1]|uniref:S9 family peptidase n=1 Tax=Flavihumibacter sp. CACIAM 22H1 TaxID=1812911 RepID=UPI0007A8BC80|nr:DPP IV N-terminal domain-containing protein [Flavihumibacter sp. CACIAM 22H1]KYP14322.1 MAG: peptidase S9 [Flavihumibacter sp. CACIAM 22H1]